MAQRNRDTEKLYWPPAELAAWQLQQLTASVARARRTPFYGPRLAQTEIGALADLTALPLTTKEDLRAASPMGLVAVPEEELYQYHESFGTTGVPAASWMTHGDMQNYAAQINHAGVDLTSRDRLLVRFPYAISVPAHIVTQAAHERGACVVPVSSRTNISPYTRVIDLLGKLKGTVIGCLPTEAVWLAETARVMGRHPAAEFPHLRAICTAGEMLSDARRERIKHMWNCDVFNMYGCTEAGNMAADCEHGQLHLSADHFVMEVLDEQNWLPVAPGELGIAVVTTLTREAMPLLRFVLGDFIRLHVDHGCPCGRTTPIIEHFGRDLNQFTFNGKRFFVRQLEERLFQAPVSAIGDLWVIELGSDAVRFRVEAAQPDPLLNRKLEGRIHAELGLPLEIDAVSPGELLDRGRFSVVKPVGKPRLIGHQRDATDDHLTIDDLMPG